MPSDPTGLLIKAWVEGRMARELDDGRTEEEARRIAWAAWDAIPAAEKALMLHPAPRRSCYRVLDPRGGD